MVEGQRKIMLTEYREDWGKHNFTNEEVKREASLPNDFENDLFDEEQKEFLSGYLADYRLEAIKRVLDFIVNIEPNGTSKKNKDAAFVRIVARVVILDSILNKRDFKVLEMKTLFGISTHQYYDELSRLTKELNDQNKNIESILKRK